jgi:acetyl-CoA acetyltransferase
MTLSSPSDPIISGVGQPAVGKFVDRLPLLLTVDAIREALVDAGLAIADIDGVATWPGRVETMLDMEPVGCEAVIDALGIKATWYNGAFESAAQYGSIASAVAAVRRGWARHVIVFRTVCQGSARRKPELFPSVQPMGLSGGMEHIIPYHAYSAAN